MQWQTVQGLMFSRMCGHDTATVFLLSTAHRRIHHASEDLNTINKRKTTISVIDMFGQGSTFRNWLFTIYDLKFESK